MTSETKKLGNLGEEIAEKYLKKKGYKILKRNFRYKGYGEIDIIAKKGGNFSFIEVKTRITNSQKGPYVPEDNITYSKQKQLIKLSKIYLAENPLVGGTPAGGLPAGGADIPWQIDVIAVEIPQRGGVQKANLRHIKQAIEDFD